MILYQSLEILMLRFGENHHILPICMGGSDSKINIIRLPPREHFFAHQLLVKIYKTHKKLVYALNMMCVGDIRSGHFRTSKRYGWIRKLFILNQPCKEDTVRKKISESIIALNARDPTIRERQRETRMKNHPSKGPIMVEKICDCGCR